MKRKLLFLLVLAMVLTLALASCKDRSVTDLEIIDGTFKYEYELGETVDLSGLKVKATYSDGAYREITADQLELGTIDTSTTGKKSFTITYDGKSITVEVEVVKELVDDTPVVTLESIAIDATSILTKVKVGDTYSTEGIKATATYSDGTTKALTAADLTVSTVDTATAGTKTLTATYEGKSAELTVTVLGVKSMQIFGAPAEISQGATLNTSGITALVTFTDDSATSVSAADLTFGTIDTTTVGEQTLTISYLDGSANVSIVVNPNAILIGIAVDTTNIGQYITGIAAGAELDLDAIKAGVIVRLQYGYSVGGAVVSETLLTDNSALTVTEATEGGRAVKIEYEGFDRSITILEGEAEIISISVAAGSFVNYVKLGGAFDPAGLMINAELSNGATVQYPLGTTGLELSAIDTATAGAKTLTVSYDGKTATALVYVLPVASITVVGTPDLRVAKGGTLDYSALTFTVIYASGSYSVTENVAIADMTVGAIDTASEGTKSFTVTYKGANGSVSYYVKEARSIALNIPADGNLDGITKLHTGASLNTDALEFTLTWSDGSTDTVKIADGVTLSGTEALANAGNHTVTISYLGATGSFQVNVNEYIIMGVSKPSNLTALENKADGSVSSKVGYFLDHSDTTYVVGDDNAFYFKLNLLALDASDKQVTITNYTSASKVYIIEGSTERLLEGAELASYVTIDETKNAFDFTEAAIGKTFKIATRPASGILDSQIASFTRTHTFKVVNAWNIHSAKELNVITNWDHSDNQVSWAHKFLDNNGIARPDGPIAGIVLHNDFHITTADLPEEYLIDTGVNDAYGNDIYNIENHFAIYPHSVDYLNDSTGKYEFTMYGNYYTVYSYGVPLIDGDISSTQLFLIDNDNAVSTADNVYDESKYLFNMYNMYLMDDDPNNPTGTAEESARAMRGLIGIKMRHVLADVKNIIIERYYISFFPDLDYVDVTLTYGKLYNAWQNHVFIYGDNNIQDYDVAPVAEDTNPKLNIVNSELTVCGGPVIISQTRTTKDNGDAIAANAKSSPDVTIDSATKIYTFVQSSAAWFQAFGAVQEAALIETLNAYFMQAHGHSYQVNNPLTGYNGMFMNIIMVNMSNGYSFGGNGGAGVQGSLTVDGTQVMNMYSSNFQQAVGALMMQGHDQSTATQMVLGGYSDVADYTGNLAVDAILAGAGSDVPPIFQSTAATAGPATLGSTAYYNGTELVDPFGQGGINGMLGTTDGYLSLYYGGMGIVFGDFHDHTGPGDGVCK